MRLHCVMPIKNECHRYLQSSIVWHRGSFDTFFIYDDRSTDKPEEIISPWRDLTFCRREEDKPSFLEHEGQFRQDMFEAFEKAVEPKEGDWILALDADEFLVSPARPAQALMALAHQADIDGTGSFTVHIPEVWSLIHPVQVRVDGFWGNLWAPRLFRYMKPATFSDKKMGGGCWPSYVNSLYTAKTNLLALLHYGYSYENDRKEKYSRYTSVAEHGHNNTHIESILAAPTLTPWPGDPPRVWRGVRG